MPQGPEHRFNVFSILSRRDDEAHRQFRFLAELLNTSGSHCQYDKFLTAFLRQSQLLRDAAYTSCRFRVGEQGRARMAWKRVLTTWRLTWRIERARHYTATSR